MRDVINLGFIGTGPRARSIFNSILMNPEFEDRVVPAAAFDVSQQALDEWQYLIDARYTDFDQFLSHEGLDAVLVITPPATHANYSVRALNRGLQVWSEVPMGLSLDELWAILDADRDNHGNHFFYGENYCWYPGIQFAAMKHQAGAIGEIYFTEGEYCHSVEHYMIAENYIEKLEVDPETHPDVHPTWRADFPPIKYGHHVGPSFYVLNHGPTQRVERPVEVSGAGNMKMQKRFQTDNFQICLCTTDADTICKFTAGFVMAHHGRLYHTFWASRGLYETGHGYRPEHYYLEIPEGEGGYPHRHQVKGRPMSDQEIQSSGIETAAGGHGGADPLMFQSWVRGLLSGGAPEINAVRGAEWTAVGICAEQALRERRVVEVPRFD
jgi:predicted dehydrogenase